jgi:hypothetical protein
VLIVEIKVNGKAAGGVWTLPWRVDVTGLLRRGANTLEIAVVNTWVNRLIGDSSLPEKERRTWLAVNGSTPSGPLEHSGLLGPVTIQAVKY